MINMETHKMIIRTANNNAEYVKGGYTEHKMDNRTQTIKGHIEENTLLNLLESKTDKRRNKGVMPTTADICWEFYFYIKKVLGNKSY